MSAARTAALPLALALDIDLEERLERVLCRGHLDDVEAMLMTVMPPWLDGSITAKQTTAGWLLESRSWPSREIKHAVDYAATSTLGISSAIETVTAYLPHIEGTAEEERLHALFVEASVAQAWLEPRGSGSTMAMMAACASSRSPGDGDTLLLAGTAFSYTAVALAAEARILGKGRGLSAIQVRSHSDADQLKAICRAYWRIIGLAALDSRKRSPKSRRAEGTEGPVSGMSIAPAALARGAASALESWRRQALAALGETGAPAEVLGAIESLDGWGPTIRRSLALVRDQVEATAYDPRCRSEAMLSVRRDLAIWTALSGDAEAARIAAYLCACAAVDGTGPRAPSLEAIGQLVAFLRVAAAASPLAHLASDKAMAPPRHTALAGEGTVRLFGETVERLWSAISNAAWTPPDAAAITLEALWSRAKAVPEPARQRGLRAAVASATSAAGRDEDSLVVIPKLPASRGGSGRDVEHDWRSLVGRALPLVPVHDLQRARADIVAKAPHCEQIIDNILADLAGQRTIRIRPTLLVGPPGSGKSTLARLILERLGVPSIVYPAAGMADASLVGTSRQWSTARASVALQQVRSTGVANPGVIIDELDKAARSPTNGRIEDGLLPLLEPSTASRVFDYLLETEVNLSGITWFATANRVEDLSVTIRDRLRVLLVPDPEPRHLGLLIPRIIQNIRNERGLRAEWIEALADDEVDLLARYWSPRSLRRLAKLVRVVLARRDELRARH